MPSIQRIGILTGGGDCPGLNAVIRAVTKTAIYQHKLRVFGIEDGFQGLAENRIGELTSLHVSGILTRGGTILGTNNKYNPCRVCVGTDPSGKPIFVSKLDDCLNTVREHRLDALMVVGGDGTMQCAMPLANAGIPCIGVPKTIDNDILGTDITFGFTTACNTATMSLDRLHSTADSHHRVIVCEVMGRNAGWLALHSGVASGSDIILIPEIPYSLDSICRFLDDRMSRRRSFAIVVVAEGAHARDGSRSVARMDTASHDPVKLGGIGERVAAELEQRTGLEMRTTVLGHVVRGGTPVAADRVLASQFGYHAVDLLMSGTTNRMIVMRNGRLDHISLAEAAAGQRLVPPDHPIIATARAVRTSFGD